jgi:uncharacterized DUF497 family protein
VRVVVDGVGFQWDAEKADANFQKHGIAFEEAAQAFFDPFAVYGDASRTDAEAREFVIGYSKARHSLLVVFTERATDIRIISARPATKAERSLYEDG